MIYMIFENMISLCSASKSNTKQQGSLLVNHGFVTRLSNIAPTDSARFSVRLWSPTKRALCGARLAE